MQKYDQNQIIDWVKTAPPADLITVTKQALARISDLPPNERDQFTREISNDSRVLQALRSARLEYHGLEGVNSLPKKPEIFLSVDVADTEKAPGTQFQGPF